MAVCGSSRLLAWYGYCAAAVRLLREELQLLQEPGSYVGEVIKVGMLHGCNSCL